VKPVFALVLALVGAALAVAFSEKAAGPAADMSPTGPVRLPHVESRLPPWLARGASLRVHGWAGSHERVRLLVDGRGVVSTLSGRYGRFELQASVGAFGLHRIDVAGSGGIVRLGSLLVRPLVLAAVGDVTPGERVSDRVAASAAADPWSSAGHVLRRADIATGNLEGVVATGGIPVAGKQYHLRGGPALLARAAKTAGMDVFTVANNHSLDFGPAAFLETLAATRSAGIATVGGGADLDAARRPAIFEAGGLRVALLGYSDVRPAGFTAGASTPGTAPAEPSLIASDVHAARRRADLVVVWFHWGVELRTQPDARQRSLADAALAAGASVVLGSHPHVLEPVERNGRKLVAWSLGNFVFPANSPGTSSTGVLLVSLDATGVRDARLRSATIHGFRPDLDGSK
jgi:poly-gamma-glutamate capsule biosynthesis protein CapA/YwtB (metallophosphatase superfamily)